MTARDVMGTVLYSASFDMPISQALALMRTHDVRHLVVVDRDDRLGGVLSNRDYRRVLERVDAAGAISGVNAITVEHIMTPADAVIAMPPDTPLLEIAQLMVTKRIGCVPIVDATRRPIGILTQKDVLAALLRQR